MLCVTFTPASSVATKAKSILNVVGRREEEKADEKGEEEEGGEEERRRCWKRKL
jgi:hypothetical protein